MLFIAAVLEAGGDAVMRFSVHGVGLPDHDAPTEFCCRRFRAQPEMGSVLVEVADVF
jgi:hypothetical protein